MKLLISTNVPYNTSVTPLQKPLLFFYAVYQLEFPISLPDNHRHNKSLQFTFLSNLPYNTYVEYTNFRHRYQPRMLFVALKPLMHSGNV